MQIDQGNLDLVDAACYLFEMVGLGVFVGDGEENAFRRGEPWDDSTFAPRPNHYVPMIYKDQDTRTVITWGGEQDFTEGWYRAKCSEVVAVLTDENLTNGKSLEGFDLDALRADLGAIADGA
jgi:hypothetical protein